VAVEAAHHDGTLRVGQLEISPDGLVTAAGVVLSLSRREHAILLHLAENHGRIVPREDIYRAVWGSELRDGDRSVDVYILKLRKKLEDALPRQKVIHTHVGFGYRLAPGPANYGR
jgi:DNA-binding response OmpR family regulator